MSEILVSHKGKKYFNMPLGAHRLTIGRSRENDLILNGDEVSRRHAAIENRAGVFWIVDQSTHGTCVNGERIATEAVLKAHDKIGIFEWQLEYCETGSAQNAEQRRRKTQLTRLIDAKLDAKPADATRVIEFADDGNSVRTLKPIVVIEDTNGVQSHCDVRKRETLVGSAPECDIVLEDDTVSKQHLLMRLTDRGFLVMDLESTNGTLINGVKIREMLICENQTIEIGRARIHVSFVNSGEEILKPFAEDEFCGMIGQGPTMKMLFARLLKAARTDMTVLIRGETGSGKEMAARAVHDLSERRDKPYVILNCGAISPSLIESELFGHEKGAFTGAVERHAGAFEQAHTGTIFLDEIGELPLELQSKILRVLEYQHVRRVGGTREIPVDVRIITATHRDLRSMVTTGRFREDLFYRLFVLPLMVPSLSEHKEDIPLLAQKFLRLSTRPKFRLEESALEKLKTHDWPGNIRELKNTLMRAMAFAENDTITADSIVLVDAPEAPAAEPIKKLSPEEQSEADRIRQVLTEVGGDKNRAAEILGIGRSTVFRKVKQLGIE